MVQNLKMIGVVAAALLVAFLIVTHPVECIAAGIVIYVLKNA